MPSSSSERIAPSGRIGIAEESGVGLRVARDSEVARAIGHANCLARGQIRVRSQLTRLDQGGPEVARLQGMHMDGKDGMETLSQGEFEMIMQDSTKKVLQDILWAPNPDHSPALEFRVDLESAENYPIFLAGQYHSEVGKLSFALIHKKVGRIYGLDIGVGHRNPNSTRVGDCHKHRWRQEFRDKFAYEPEDITETYSNPEGVWRQFCMEANIEHSGVMRSPGREMRLFQ